MNPMQIFCPYVPSDVLTCQPEIVHTLLALGFAGKQMLRA